jgi:GTP1/Obg family GTP-binding protein
MKELTRVEKIKRVQEATLKEVEKMVKEGRSSEEIARFQSSMMQTICDINNL